MNTIEQIASKHLGKAGNGTVVTPYVTPDTIDASLLVPIPRVLNRTHYGIENKKPGSVGKDIWNAYEVSALLDNGFPVNFYVRIVYDSTSEFIVESKSLKLYLNSFNMHRFSCIHESFAAKMIETTIKTDLTTLLGVTPEIGVFGATDNIDTVSLQNFPILERSFDSSQFIFDEVRENPSLLKVANGCDTLIVRTALLRSNCRVTNQPDWGDVYIVMKGGQTPTLSSLAQYIVSMRKENHFHEEICECIYKRLYDKFSPTNMLVSCLYTRRGGIDINPVRYSSETFFEEHMNKFASKNIIYKTVRQ